MIKKVEIDPPMKTDATVHQLNEKIQVIHLYQDLLKSWNDRDTDAYTNLFTNDGNIIGFDGSQANGRKEIYSHIEQIFTGHQTGTYISIVQEIRFLTPDLALLRAIAGLVLPGKMDINPGINAIQTLVAQKMEDRFRIAVFQNTPAAFHGHPELSEQLTKELREVLATSL